MKALVQYVKIVEEKILFQQQNKLKKEDGVLHSHKIKYNIRKIEGNYIFELIDIVIRKEKEKGLGTELMKKIIDFCDKNKLKIELRASDFYGSSIDRLISFYKKFGFVEGNDINQMGHLMQRNPK